MEPKNLFIGLVLTFFFGPFGLLYATISGGLIMMGVSLVILMIGAFSFGFGWFLFLGAAVVELAWCVKAIQEHNSNLYRPYR